MSIVNVAVEPQRIRITSDTLTYAKGAPLRFTRSKVYEVGAGLMTCRGLIAYNEQVSELCLIAGTPGALLRLFPKCAPKIIDPPLDGLTAADRQFELVFVAPDEDGALAAVRCVYRDGEGYAERLAAGFHIHPGLYSERRLRADMDADGLRRVALAQWNLSKRRDLNMCIGGDVQVVTLDAAGRITRETIGEFPNKAEHAALFERRESHTEAARA